MKKQVTNNQQSLHFNYRILGSVILQLIYSMIFIISIVIIIY